VKARRPPLPPPLRPLVLAVGLGAGVGGTGLLYTAATQGRLGDLVAGAVGLGLGLTLAGHPFVLATAWHRRARRTARGAAHLAPPPR
jgi:hypothetical protein